MSALTIRERRRTHSLRQRLHAAARVAGRDACQDGSGARRALNATYRAAYRQHVTRLLLEPIVEAVRK